MAEEMERHFGAQQIGKGRVGGIGVTAAGNALVAQVIEGIPCQQVGWGSSGIASNRTRVPGG